VISFYSLVLEINVKLRAFICLQLVLNETDLKFFKGSISLKQILFLSA